MNGCHKESCLSTCCDNIKEEIDSLKKNFIGLRKWIADLDNLIYETRDQLRKLETQVEEINGQKFSEFHRLTPRIEKLERHFSGDYQLIASQKIPHKCPLCEGIGYWHSVENNIASGGQCKSCEGKGIVWG
jgi:hypothetical protein